MIKHVFWKSGIKMLHMLWIKTMHVQNDTRTCMWNEWRIRESCFVSWCYSKTINIHVCIVCITTRIITDLIWLNVLYCILDKLDIKHFCIEINATIWYFMPILDWIWWCCFRCVHKCIINVICCVDFIHT